MASVTISDFKITVKLDSKQAMAGLRSLHSKLNAFAHHARSTMKIDANGVKVIREKVKQTSKLNRVTKTLNKTLRTTARILKSGIQKPFSMISGFLGDWKYLLAGIAATTTYMVARITKSGMAMQRATIAMMSAVGASDIGLALSPQQRAELQKDQLAFAQRLAKIYGLGLTDTVNEYAKFFAASSKYIGVTGSEHLFKSFAKLSVVYGLTAEKQKRAMTAFTQMASKNQVMAEELKQQLGDVLPGSMEIFARAMTKMGKWGVVTVERLYDMMAKGKIVASEVLPAVADEMQRMAEPTLAEALKTTAVQLSRLGTQMEATSAGIFNQFEGTLSVLLTKLTAFLTGEGMQVTIGETIENAIKGLTEFLQPLFDEMDAFERKWKSATRAGKIKLLDEGSFYKSVLKGLKDAITDAWDALDLTPLKNRLIDLLADVIAGVSSELVDRFFTKEAPKSEMYGGKILRYADTAQGANTVNNNNVTQDVNINVNGISDADWQKGLEIGRKVAEEFNANVTNPMTR